MSGPSIDVIEEFGTSMTLVTMSLVVKEGRVYAGCLPRHKLARDEHEVTISHGLALARALGAEAEVIKAIETQALVIAERARAARERANIDQAMVISRALYRAHISVTEPGADVIKRFLIRCDELERSKK